MDETTTTKKQLPEFVPGDMHNLEYVQAVLLDLSTGTVQRHEPGINISLVVEYGRPLPVNLKLLEALKLYQQLKHALNSLVVWGAEGVSPELRMHLAKEMNT